MIISCLTGGLGNQLFQYAAARSISILHKTSLIFDTRQFQQSSHRYLLDKFNIKASIATTKDIDKLVNSKLAAFFHHVPEKFQKYYGTMVKLRYKTFFYEKNYRFDCNFDQYPDNIYLLGYWQSEKYFYKYQDLIKKELTLKRKMSEGKDRLSWEIKRSNSISIHIRRGDYFNDPVVNKKHGCLGMNYYLRAIAHIVKRIKNPFFYVFSDDYHWVKRHFKIEYPFQVMGNHNTKKAYENLILGGYCKHNICANSTFSWWTAWLNNNPHKIVIVPDNWYKDKTIETQDLFPDGWIKI